MDGYGEFYWNDGKKYFGFYKKDKKEGFGFHYLLNDSFYIGFCKDGQRSGLGKYIKGDSVKYGFWKNGKKEKFFENEKEFFNNIKNGKKVYINLFKMSIEDVKKYMELEGL